ncbi:glycerophosphodiester phosphodiesterase [Mesobacillus campisalis]|uniref:Glycerophosphodiester phosphodiesterase n=1 Tax=Mesobacillus campisalis TaxID=1408103 RepID=A0A0M2SVP2_9BACI|nr:glycerophosphodiester phosphodiesterase [Mesobacillus campisalis]KKK38639.1 glycerophosphodiester phosphodiesterase [Mesobacillus campisalis]
MKGRWFAAVAALAISLSMTAGGEDVLAGDKHRDVVIVSHRGASGHAPEHTLVSYELGTKMHGDYIEIDLQMTKDGHLIAMHDMRVDRTTNGTGLVKEATLSEIKKLDGGSWFNGKYPQFAKPEYAGLKVPTLEEVFQKFGKNRSYYIETKSPNVYPGMENELLRLVNHYQINKNKLLVQSFSSDSLKTMHDLDPSIKLVQLLSYRSNAVISQAEIEEVKTYATGLGANQAYLNEEYVKQVTASGLELHVYTVNDKARMQQLIDWGVTGMFTNFPDLLHKVMKEI